MYASRGEKPTQKRDDDRRDVSVLVKGDDDETREQQNCAV
jgi:hypothetical protein